VVGRDEHIVTIPGTRSTARLDENAAAAEIVLTQDEQGALEKAVPKGATAGGRYPEASAVYLNG
jgi:aryl-alcohol dehydrogenase-like predicted oxidoreductase